MELNHTIPAWINYLSLVTVLGTIFLLDYLAALWLNPTNNASATPRTKQVFLFLFWFSILGLLIGVCLTAFMPFTPQEALIAAILLLVLAAWALLPKRYWIVASISYMAAYTVGDVLIEYNAFYAGLVLICTVIGILIMVITLGPLTLFKKP